MKKTDPPIIVEETYSTTIQKVWAAITELSEMKQWYFEQLTSFKAEVGFSTQFAVHVEDRTYTHLWEITEVIENKKIKYNLKYEECEGDSFVTFELFEHADGVLLRFSTEVVEDFPSDKPEFARESGVAGWEYFIKGNLKKYLEGSD